MILLIPYRAKNPPERYPYVTLALMAANVLIYALTSAYFLRVRESVVEAFALSFNTLGSEPWRVITNTFLHGDLMHLGGNLLFLWIFGPSVEGRLGYLKYLGVYLFAGVTASLLQILMVSGVAPEQFLLGASGSIMGMAGAYLWLFPFATICVVFGYPTFVFWRISLQEWHARWVALWLLGWDLFQGVLLHALGLSKYGGVGHFAHVGGAVGALLAVMLLRAKRDTEAYSEAQKARVDTGGHYPAMGLHELETLIAGQPDNVAAIQAYCRKAVTTSDGTGYSLCYRMLSQHGRAMVERGDPLVTAQLMLTLPDAAGRFPSSLLLRLGSRLESEGEYVMAGNVFRHLHRSAPTGPDTEMALLRLAHLTEQTEPDKGRAAAVYAEMLRLFPNGSQSTEARAALRRLPPPSASFTDVPLDASAYLAAGGGGAPPPAETPAPPQQAPPGVATVPGHTNVPGAPAMPMIAFDAPVSRNAAAAAAPDDGGGNTPLRPLGG